MEIKNLKKVTLYNKRYLFITEAFKKDIKEINEAAVLNKVETVLNEISTQLLIKPKEVNNYLMSKTAKKFKGINLWKFYITDSHRVIYGYGKDIGKEKYRDSIFILRYVTKHDMQGKVAKNSRAQDSDIFYVKEKYKLENINEGKIFDNELIYFILPQNIHSFLYKQQVQAQMLLNSEQEKCLSTTTPLIIRGNAGSGKTLVSLNLIKELENSDDNVVYLTFSEELKRSVVQEYKSWGYTNIDSFYSIQRYYIKMLGLNINQYVDYNVFEEWYNNRKDIKKFNSIDIWAEIRGLLKGYMYENWDRKYHLKDCIEEEVYFQSKVYSKFNEEDKRKIYNICNEYNLWLNKNKLYDDNDLAIAMIRKLENKEIGQVDVLVVDEVQDLTDIQIESIFSLVKNYNIYLCGDQNQIINPTLFDFKRLSLAIYMKTKLNNRGVVLKNNYRNTSCIIDYVNNISLLRMKYIGRQKHYDDEFEIPIRKNNDSKRIKNIKNSNINLDNIIEIFQNTPSAAIIVLTDKEKLEIEKMYGREINCIFSVHEVKGLEFNHVVCYNLISRKVDVWREIFTYNGRKSSKYRYYFNLFYVAITRAREYLFFLEENVPLMIKEQIFKFPIIDEVTEDILEIKYYSSPEEWFNEGKKFEKVSDYKRAIHCYEKYERIINDSKKNNSNKCKGKLLLSKREYDAAGECFLQAEEYELAKESFELSNNKNKLLETLLKIGENEKFYSEINELINDIEIDQHIIDLVLKYYFKPLISEYKEECQCITEIVLEDLREVKYE